MARQNFVGFVISQGKMDKTVKVRVMQKVLNKKLQKEYLKKKDFLVHDEANICKEGDLVRIEATRPLSARKSFAVAEIKKNKGEEFQHYQEEAKRQVAEEETRRRQDLLRRRELYNNSSTLYHDLDEVKMLRKPFSELSEEEREKIANLKLKYGISNWDAGFENQELFMSSLSHLANKLESIRSEVELSKKLEDIIAKGESDTTFRMLVNRLDLDPATTKKNIMKNKMRRVLQTASGEELAQWGIDL
ncbi:hypothetical protein KL911_004321 [Ogataea haglerorum]|uniref:uncharacterized protein n=1 Tax=Ogataea haglerorum TaxID=1937702 RepID=UPI001C8A73AA|nr:uncharacterized protein KL911_004321 [Ogataea haglerorum]KAG7746048.1 hypothetical protein KL912_004609 [Ogataea haglerorum]KAG7751743.1 hypothetical protein KL911_004321 [Ogataea haglerorum]